MNLNDSVSYEKRNCFNKVMDKTNSKKKFMKNMMSRSGSYNVTGSEDDSNNSLHFIESYTNSLPNAKSNFKSTNSILNMFSGFSSKKDTKKFNDKQPMYHKRLMGLSLLYLTYLSAFYTLVAYSASVFITIVFIIQNLDVILIPLYILLVSYLLIAIMSLFLIFGIKKDRLNIITFWVIIISVFLLPEIGLNIILLESKPDWSYNEYRFLLISLIIRILLNFLAIFFVLTYHINQIKRNNHLQDMLQPLKNNIVNGEVLKIYNNIKLEPFEQPNNVVQLSNPLVRQKHPESMNLISQNTNNQNRYLYKFNTNQAIFLKEVKNDPITIEDQMNVKNTIPRLDLKKMTENFHYDKKSLHLIWGKKSQPTQPQEQMNIINESCEDSFTNDEIMAHHFYPNLSNLDSKVDDLNSLDSRPNYQNDSISVDAVLNLKDTENNNYIQMMQDEFNKLPMVKANPLYMHNITEISHKSASSSSLRRCYSLNNNVLKENEQEMNIPIEYEGPIIRLMIKKNEPMKLQQIPKLDNETNLAMQKKTNVSNHHIYLPPGPEFIPKYEEESTLVASSFEITKSTHKSSPGCGSTKSFLTQNDNNKNNIFGKLNQVDL